MIDKNQDIDKLAEDILSAYGKELCKSRKAYFDALEDDSVPDPPFFAEPVRKKIRTRKNLPPSIDSRRRTRADHGTGGHIL